MTCCRGNVHRSATSTRTPAVAVGFRPYSQIHSETRSLRWITMCAYYAWKSEDRIKRVPKIPKLEIFSVFPSVVNSQSNAGVDQNPVTNAVCLEVTATLLASRAASVDPKSTMCSSKGSMPFLQMRDRITPSRGAGGTVIAMLPFAVLKKIRFPLQSSPRNAAVNMRKANVPK